MKFQCNCIINYSSINTSNIQTYLSHDSHMEHSFSAFGKFTERLTFLTPWYAHFLPPGAYQDFRNRSFSKNFVYVLNKWSPYRFFWFFEKPIRNIWEIFQELLIDWITRKRVFRTLSIIDDGAILRKYLVV